MSNASFVLGTNWDLDEWPEYVSVIHEANISHGNFSQGKMYVPERTCKNLFSYSDVPRFWCSKCEFKSSYPGARLANARFKSTHN